MSKPQRAVSFPDAHARGYWNVWMPDDDRERSGTLLAGPMRSREAASYARGYNDALRAVEAKKVQETP